MSRDMVDTSYDAKLSGRWGAALVLGRATGRSCAEACFQFLCVIHRYAFTAAVAEGATTTLNATAREFSDT